MKIFFKRQFTLIKDTQQNQIKLIFLNNKICSKKIINFNFSTKNHNENNTDNTSHNSDLYINNDNLNIKFNLSEDQKIDFDSFYNKMKKNVDSLVEINQRLKENSGK